MTYSQFPEGSYTPVAMNLLPEKRTKFLDLIDFALELLFDTELSHDDVTNRAHTLGRQVEKEYYKLATEDRKRVLIGLCWIVGINAKVLKHLNEASSTVDTLKQKRSELEALLTEEQTKTEHLNLALSNRDATIAKLNTSIAETAEDHSTVVANLEKALAKAKELQIATQGQLTFEQSVVRAARQLITTKDAKIEELTNYVARLQRDLRIASQAIDYYKGRGG